MNSRIYEYTEAANPKLSCNKPLGFFPKESSTNIQSCDVSKQLSISYPCTSPNLLANFIHIDQNDRISTFCKASSQVFYVINGSGHTKTEDGIIDWKKGDVFVIPFTIYDITHHADTSSLIYWVHDQPLLNYLGAVPQLKKFQQTHFNGENLFNTVNQLSDTSIAQEKNRCGILLGIKETELNTRTLTHTQWALLNKLPKKSIQKPHKHNSIALDLCISAEDLKVYTLIGNELDDDGTIINPIKVYWKSSSMFITPPGMWHSHHNDSEQDAWVFPIQDAGILTYQRILGIEFT